LLVESGAVVTGATVSSGGEVRSLSDSDCDREGQVV
jgi:hypothetical protein